LGKLFEGLPTGALATLADLAFDVAATKALKCSGELAGYVGRDAGGGWLRRKGTGNTPPKNRIPI